MWKKNWLIIGVGGATCSGKTSLATKLKENLKDAVIFHQDKYFHPENDPRHVHVPELNHHNWDNLTAVDMERMHQDILETLKSNETDQQSRRPLIVDGFLIYNYKPIADLCELRYFIHLTYEACLERRVKREYDPPDVPGYFEKIVWPEFKKHYAEIIGNQELKNTIKFLDGTLPSNEIFQQVFSEVKQKLKS